MRTLRPLLLLVPLVCAACDGGGADPRDLTSAGYTALGSGDAAGAVAEFEKALEVIAGDTAHPDYLRAKLGQIEALTLTDPERAKNDLFALHEALPGKITDRHFNQIGGRLGGAKKFDQAIAVLERGQRVFPDSAHLEELLEELGDRVKDEGDPAALEKLRGLGYVGD